MIGGNRGGRRNGRPQHQGQGRSQRQGGGGANARPWWAPPQTQGEATRQAYRETRPEYLPVKRQLHQEIKASNQRRHEIGGWWNEYLQTVAGTQAANQQAYANAAQQQAALMGQASSTDNAATQRLNQEAQASAALRGQAAPTTAITGRANAAQAERNTLSATQGGALAAQGANQYAYLGERRRIGAGQRVKAMTEETKRGLSTKEDLLAAKKEQGGQAAKYLQEARDRYGEEALKRKAFGLEKHEAGEKAREGAFDRGREREKAQHEREDARRANAAQRNENREQRNQNAEQRNQNRQAHKEEEEAKHGESKLTPSERNDLRRGRKDAAAAARSLYEKKSWPSWAALETRLRKESEVSPADARWATRKLREKVEREERQQRNITRDPNGASLGR